MPRPSMDPALRIKYLRNWREAQNLTLKDLAAILDRSYVTLWKWENGGAMVPDWLPDWLEYVEIQVGLGRGRPACPSKASLVRRILYAEVRDAQDAQDAASARWKAAGEQRTALKLKRDERRSLRLQRRISAERMVQNKDGGAKRRKPTRTADEKMQDMARQLKEKYPGIIKTS